RRPGKRRRECPGARSVEVRRSCAPVPPPQANAPPARAASTTRHRPWPEYDQPHSIWERITEGRNVFARNDNVRARSRPPPSSLQFIAWRTARRLPPNRLPRAQRVKSNSGARTGGDGPPEIL